MTGSHCQRVVKCISMRAAPRSALHRTPGSRTSRSWGGLPPGPHRGEHSCSALPIGICPDRGPERSPVCFPLSMDRCGDGCHGRYSRGGNSPPSTGERRWTLLRISSRSGPDRSGRSGQGGFSRYRDTSAPLSICRESPEMRPELAGEDALRVHRYMEGHEELP